MAWLGLGLAIQLVADLVIGVRLLRLARRTRELPEAAFGWSFVLLGGLGYPLAVVARGSLAGAAPAAAGALLALALSAQNLACFALAVGVGHVFRRESRAARVLLVALAAAYVASVAGQATTLGFHGARDGGFFYFLGLAARALPFGWSVLESLRYHAVLRRRLPLGLASTIVTDRVRLWGVASASVFAGFVIFAAARLAGANPGTSPLVLASTSVIGVVAAVALWLAFLPPAAYLRRLDRAALALGVGATSSPR
jgi:uncharacterized SAM-binding protein YcdF (DUF218 family)